jgi:hypothetical protein
MPSQFPISNPYLFEKDKGVGFGSFYCGHAHLIYANKWQFLGLISKHLCPSNMIYFDLLHKLIHKYNKAIQITKCVLQYALPLGHLEHVLAMQVTSNN